MAHINRKLLFAIIGLVFGAPQIAGAQAKAVSLKVWYPSAFGSYNTFDIGKKLIAGSKPLSTSKPLAVVGNIHIMEHDEKGAAVEHDYIVRDGYKIGIGTGVPQAVVDVTGPGGILLPRLNTAQAKLLVDTYGAKAIGTLIYNPTPCIDEKGRRMDNRTCRGRAQFCMKSGSSCVWRNLSLSVGAEMQIFTGGNCPSGWEYRNGNLSTAQGTYGGYGAKGDTYFTTYCTHGSRCSNFKCYLNVHSMGSSSYSSSAKTCYTTGGDYLVAYLYDTSKTCASIGFSEASSGSGFVGGYAYYYLYSGSDASGYLSTTQARVRTCYKRQ